MHGYNGGPEDFLDLPARSSIRVERNIRIPMSDGATLSAISIYRTRRSVLPVPQSNTFLTGRTICACQ
jgi:hypothetical protein